MRSIPPVLLSKIKEQNQTIYNNANPKMSIQVSRAKDTVMDSSYWTVETIREKEGLGDLSIAARRFKPYGPPNRLYNIYVDNSVVKTAIREYPDYKKLKWQNQFDVGVGSAVAIAFDGHWERYRKKWQLVTEENPYLFWVDGSNKLWVQLWDNVGTKYELASNVSKVKALRCWKNINIHDVDQGIVVGYIKSDGKVYYKNYAYQSSGQFAWEAERQVTEFPGTSVNLNLFISNDYRMGFIVEDSSGNICWAITSRAWAGMAIAPERFFIRASASVDFLKVNHINTYHDEKFVVSANASANLLWGSPYNEFINIENIDDGEGNFGKRVIFTMKYRISEFNSIDFVLTDEDDVEFNCIYIAESEDSVQYNWQYKAEFSNFNNAKGDVDLTCKGLYAKNDAGYSYDNFNEIFTPTGLVPSDVPAPSVVGLSNDDDKSIIIDFDYPIISGVDGSKSAFTISSEYWKDTFEDTKLSEGHIVDAISQISNTRIKLLLTYPQSRIRRANKITIKYNSAQGHISGETYPLNSFEVEFEPGVDKILNPAVREKFTVTTNADIEFLKVNYIRRYVDEHFVISTGCKISFIHVDDINP